MDSHVIGMHESWAYEKNLINRQSVSRKLQVGSISDKPLVAAANHSPEDERRVGRKEVHAKIAARRIAGHIPDKGIESGLAIVPCCILSRLEH